MDEKIYVILKVLLDFALEVRFSIVTSKITDTYLVSMKVFRMFNIQV